jgi:hypothetical protein
MVIPLTSQETLLSQPTQTFSAGAGQPSPWACYRTPASALLTCLVQKGGQDGAVLNGMPGPSRPSPLQWPAPVRLMGLACPHSTSPKCLWGLSQDRLSWTGSPPEPLPSQLIKNALELHSSSLQGLLMSYQVLKVLA